MFSVRELGKFHGECYALKESNRGLFHIITKAFKESRYSREPDAIWGATSKISPKRGTHAIRENAELKRIVPEEFLKKIEEKSDHVWEYWRECVKPREPLATICHGDYLRNNIAFQFDDKVSVESFDLLTSWPFREANIKCQTFIILMSRLRTHQSEQ